MRSVRAVLAWLAVVWVGLAEEIMIGLGVGLVACGFWWTWKPGAFFAAGAVILWIFLPPRWPFITQMAVEAKPKKRTPR